MSNLESRGEIKTKIEKRKVEANDRAKHMGLVVDDKKIVSDTSRKLRLEGTKEGAEAIKRQIREAGKKADGAFDRQNEDLKKKLAECKSAEEDLHKRTDRSQSDARDMRNRRQGMKEAKDAARSVEGGEKAATEDAKFTDEKEKEQKRNREHSERRRNEQKSQLHAAKLKW